MTKQISEYTVEELSAKIEAIKAERERTENALKRYEEELEQRKQKVPLGVPVTIDTLNEMFYSVSGTNDIWSELRIRSGVQEHLLSAFNTFNSEESAKKHAEMLLDWRMALVANSEGEPIDIKVLLPLLPKGWVAMEENGVWCHYTKKPVRNNTGWETESIMDYNVILLFNIKPAENWETSLMECGL